jgi:hypothetical protein
MPININQSLKQFYAPRDISFLTALSFFGVLLLLYGCMCIYFYDVIQDNNILNESPTYKMINGADSFIKDIGNDMCGIKLLDKHKWLKQFDILINSNFNIISKNVKYLMITGYIIAIYNTMLMHFLLCDLIPAPIIYYIPITISFVSSLINPTQLYLLGALQFIQVFFTFIIVCTFVSMKEKKINSQININSDLCKSS